MQQDTRGAGVEHHITPSRPAEDASAHPGVSWWNDLSETDRAYWCRVACSAVPAAAYAAYLARHRPSPDAAELRQAIISCAERAELWLEEIAFPPENVHPIDWERCCRAAAQRHADDAFDLASRLPERHA